MKLNKILFLVAILIAGTTPFTVSASTLKPYAILKVLSNNNLIVSDSSDIYLVKYGYGCSSSDFNEDDIIYNDGYINLSALSKLYYQAYGRTESCSVSESTELNNPKYFFVNSVIDSDDEIIVTDSRDDTYRLEYGTGCLSMWRYEDKNILIDIGGSFLDGIGDQIYLLDSDQDCKVWDADDVQINNTGGYATLSDPPTSSLPYHSDSPINFNSLPDLSTKPNDQPTIQEDLNASEDTNPPSTTDVQTNSNLTEAQSTEGISEPSLEKSEEPEHKNWFIRTYHRFIDWIKSLFS